MPRMTSKVFKEYTSDLLKLASVLEAKHNLKLVMIDGRLNGANAVVRLEMQSLDEVDWRTSPEARAFLCNAQTYGLEPEDLGAVFYLSGKPYKIVGYNGSRPKNCFILQNMEGKEYKAGPMIVGAVKQARKPRQVAAS